MAPLDALGVAELIRTGQLTSSEVCQEAIDRIEALNPKLNAVVTPLFDLALETAKGPLPPGPFSGVPFLLKDLVEVLGGARLTMGCKAARDFVPSVDNEVVSRFKRSGVVILGKTNVPEFGLTAVTESKLHGPCRNPWNPDFSPGGSSGGSAAAVASGMVPIASANDGGGSIRIPAAWCGLVGLKPSRGRTPTGPVVAELWQGAAVSHIVSRSVRDSAAMLDVLQGPEPGSPYLLPPPDQPYLRQLERGCGKLRIGFTTESPLGTPVHPECVNAVESAAKCLQDLGHEVEQAQPQIDGRALAKSFLCMVFGEVANDVAGLKVILGRKPVPSDVEPETWSLALLGRAFSAADMCRARRFWGTAARAMGRFHEQYDFYLTPTTAQPPLPIGKLKPGMFRRLAMTIVNQLGLGRVLRATGITDQLAEAVLSAVPFTQLANATGQPAISLPMHWTGDALPCGVQFVAALGNEAGLLRLARQLEEARPWSGKHPPVFAESGV